MQKMITDECQAYFYDIIIFIDDLCCGTVLVRKINQVYELKKSCCANQSPLL